MVTMWVNCHAQGTLSTQFGNHGSGQWGAIERCEAGEWHNSEILSIKNTLADGWRKDGNVNTRDKGNSSEMASVFQE